jgi:hypothetical protein
MTVLESMYTFRLYCFCFRSWFSFSFVLILVVPKGRGILPIMLVISRTRVLHCCPSVEDAHCEAWKDQTTGAVTRPRSIGALLGNPLWEKLLLSFLEKTNIGRFERNDGWRREPFV